MDSIRLVQFDIHGTNPLNTFKREEHKLVDKTLPWIIPNGSPFFADLNLVAVYNQAGGRLIRERDYWVEEEFVPFCEVTGRSICCFIRLHQDIIDANDKVFTDYQSLGANFVPRNSLQQWIDEMQRGKIPVPWSKVFGVPATLPPSLHMHSIKTEISDWYELTFFFKYLTDIVKTTNNEVFDETVAVGSQVFSRLKALKNENLARMKIHDSNYNNPHGITAALLLLGNVPNYRAATLAEDLAGTRTDVLSTPLGVQEYVKSFIPDTSTVMLSGVLPISKFGGNTFIPPNISGSFEGLGSPSLYAGFCVENSGALAILAPHFDGRVEGLYFTLFENFETAASAAVYTSFKYENPYLKSINFEPNAIVPGSDNNVIMVGRSNTNDWYISLGNSTFDPNAHNYVKCDMTAAVNLIPATYLRNMGFHRLHFMDDYIVLSIGWGGALVHRWSFFRIKRSDLLGPNPKAVWELMNVSYTNYHGQTKTNQQFLQAFEAVGNTVDGFSRFGRSTYNPVATSASMSGTGLALSCAKSSSPGIYYFQIGIRQYTVYNKDGISKTCNDISNMVFEFNPANGNFNVLDKSPPKSINFLTDPEEDLSFISSEASFIFQFVTYPSGIVTANGTVVCLSLFSNSSFPFTVRVKHSKFNTRESLISGLLLDERVFPLTINHAKVQEVKNPILSGINPNNFNWFPDGELYSSTDVTTGRREKFYRIVSGEYAVREEVSNLNIPNLYSRPLTNRIYKTDLLSTDGTITITGTAAELTAGGVPMGSSEFSACAYSASLPTNQHLPTNPKFRAPGSNVLITFPRTHTKTVNAATQTVEFEANTFYGFNQNVINKVRSFIPSDYTDIFSWGFSLYVMNNASGGMFRNMELAIIKMVFIDRTKPNARSKDMLIRLVIEAPNAQHPGVYLITDFVLLDSPPHSRASITTALMSSGLHYNMSTLPSALNMYIYKEGNKLTVYHNLGMYSPVAGSTHKYMSYLEIDLSTNKITAFATGGISYGFSDIGVSIPKVGMSDILITNMSDPETTNIASPGYLSFDSTGGAGSIYLITRDGVTRSFLMGSIYPETGWVIYLPENIKMLIHGTSYTVRSGTIDLRDIDTDPRSKVFYLYITVEDDKPQYIVSLNKLRKSNALLMVAVITTNDKQILTIERKQPFMIGDFMLGYTREGGIIPVSTGLPQEEGVFAFLREAELLP